MSCLEYCRVVSSQRRCGFNHLSKESTRGSQVCTKMSDHRMVATNLKKQSAGLQRPVLVKRRLYWDPKGLRRRKVTRLRYRSGKEGRVPEVLQVSRLSASLRLDIVWIE